MTTSKSHTAVSLGIAALFITFSAAMLALVLPSGGWKALSVQTGSMKPVLRPGDLVMVHKLSAADYKDGDVVTYVNPQDKGQTITHRIVQTTDGGKRRIFQTKGDANNAADRPIKETAIVGRQEFSVPYLGHVIDFIHTLPGLLLIIYLPALWIIVGETKRLAAYYRKIRPYSLYPQKQQGHSAMLLAGLVSGALVVAVIGVAAPAFAAINSSATMTGNIIGTISTGPVEPPPDNNGSTVVTCINTNSVNVNNSTSQTAISGSATSSGNTNGGTATSGNVSNSNSTSVEVNIENGNCSAVPAQ